LSFDIGERLQQAGHRARNSDTLHHLTE
jgi:hypothetical protein